MDLYQMHLVGLSTPGRPIGSGKTQTVGATAKALVQNPGAVIKIDCGEFQHSHEIAKLIGSPPGCLGHRETHTRCPLDIQQLLCSSRRFQINIVSTHGDHLRCQRRSSGFLVPGDLLPAKADGNEYAFTLINPGSTSDVINKLIVFVCRLKPGQPLLISPFRDLAAGVHAALKLLQ
jgi:hypothetical protein